MTEDNGSFEPSFYIAPDDNLADREANALASGKSLEEDGEVQEHGRHQTFRNHANIAAIILLWTIFGLTLVGVLVFTLHLVLPSYCHWMSSAALEKVQTLIAAALLSSAMTGYVNRRMA